MKHTLCLLALFILLLPGTTHAQKRQWYQPPKRPARPHRRKDPAYRLNKRVFIKWNPASLIPASAAVIRLGAEYDVRGNIGLALDAGYVFYRDPKKRGSFPFNLGAGFQLNPEARLYFGFRRNGRGFVVLQGLYLVQYMGPQHSSIGLQGYAYEYSQSAATLQVTGVGAGAGFVIRLAGQLHLEPAAGLGIKLVNWNRKDLTLQRTGSNYRYYNFEYTENDVLDRETLSYFFLQLKLSWLLGPPIKKHR